MHDAVVIGAGPAGLTAAYELARRGRDVTVLEKTDHVGGLARTEVYKGFRFDIGGHRFFTKVGEVEQLWREMLGEKLIKVPRLSRIYYRGRFFDYPLAPLNALANLGLLESLRVLLSYGRARCRPAKPEETFEHWVGNRFGRRLYRTFFKTYTEKVWGLPCSQIQADWAAQRIKGLSLTTAAMNALFGTNGSKSLLAEFDYPERGPGMMWQRFAEAITQLGGRIRLACEIERLARERDRIVGATARCGDERSEIAAAQFISSMPLSALIAQLDPPAPAPVREAAQRLRYRDFLLVGLIVDRAALFPDNWIYVHSPEVAVGRIQNFKNWSAAMVPDPRKTSLGMEYFCSTGDRLWSLPDEELIALATRELAALGLARADEVEDGIVVRQRQAYPVYDRDYRRHLDTIQAFLRTIENLQTIGRNGMHRYNNQDHSMLTGLLAVRNLQGEAHDLWTVNTERSYYEEFEAHQ